MIAAWSFAQLHAMVLHWFGYPWPLAIWDALISNGLLFGTALLVTLILQYYIPQKNRYLYIVALCLVLTIAWFFVARTFLFMVPEHTREYELIFAQSAPIRITIGLLLICCMALVSVLIYTLQDQQQAERRKAEAEKLAKDAELTRLRQQLQPHFLFNSLNSINALIGSQPDLARTMVQQLSGFLRGTLRKEENQWVSLKDELDHLQLYLDIEKVRFGHRLQTVTTYEPAIAELRLPAMLLQPVVENAIKFGLYDTTGDITIKIEATSEEGDLVLAVSNPYDQHSRSNNTGTGFGLSSVKKRLALLYARHDLLKAKTEDGIFITSIKIPQVDDKGIDHR